MFATLGKIFRFVIIGSCLVALIFQFINTASCTFIYKSSQDGNGDGTIDFGLYHMGINSECLEGKYDALLEQDNLLEKNLLGTARACHITSMIAGAIGMLFVLIEFCCCKIPCGGLIEGIAFLIAWTNGLSVFMVFGMEGCGTYIHIDALQGKLDSMTSVAGLFDSMDANPESDFSFEALQGQLGNMDNMPSVAGLFDSMDTNPESDDFSIEALQGQLDNEDNMTSVAGLMDSMDANPQSDGFSIEALKGQLDNSMNPMKELFTNLENNPLNLTELVPNFVELVPFGTECEWGQGATYNLIAALLYLGCGLLLCVTPRPVHSSNSNDDNDNDNDRASLVGSRTNLS